MKLRIIFLIFLILLPIVYSPDISTKSEKMLSQKELQAMTSEQIADHFDEIDDLTKISENGEEASKKAIEAIGKKYGIKVTNLGWGGAIIRKGVLSSTYGNKGTVALTNDYYKKGTLEIDSIGNIIFKQEPENFMSGHVLLDEPPKSDKLIIDTNGKDSYLIFGAKDDKKTIELNGRLSFDNDDIYIFNDYSVGEHLVTIDGVQFISSYNNPIPIFIDEVPKDKTEYILFDRKNKKLTIDVDRFGIDNVHFMKNNPFLKIASTRDVSFKNIKDMQISIEDRNKDKLIPFVQVKFKKMYKSDYKSNKFELNNGAYSIYEGNGGGINIVGSSGPNAINIPMSLNIVNEDGTNIIGTKEYPQIIIMDGESISTVAMESLEKIKLMESSLYINYNYNIEKFMDEFPQIYFENIYTMNSLDLAMFATNLRKLPPEVLESIRKVSVHDPNNPDKKWEEICGVSWAGACATPEGEIRFRTDSILDEATLFHEAGHTQTFKLMGSMGVAKLKKLIDGINLKEDDSWDKRRIIHSRISDYYKRINLLRQEETFESRWLILEPNYNLVKETETKLSTNPAKTSAEFKWAIPTYSGEDKNPRYGFIHPYGGQNFMEDVATFAEKAHTDPRFFGPLINQGDPKKNIYLRKLGLLYEYGFITPADYKKLLKLQK